MTYLQYCVIFILLSPRSCRAWRAWSYSADLHLKDKLIVGEPEGTLLDTTLVTCGTRCTTMSTCDFFFHHASSRKCVLCSARWGASIALQDAPGYLMYTMNDVPFDSSVANGTNECSAGTTVPKECWMLIEDKQRVTRISVGPAGVWVSNKNYSMMYKDGTYQSSEAVGNEWLRTYWNGTWVDVGTDIAYGIDEARGQLSYRTGISAANPKGDSWTDMNIDSIAITVSPAGSTWFLNGSGDLFQFKDLNPREYSNWFLKASGIKHVDAGAAGVWAIDWAGRLHHGAGTYEDQSSTGKGSISWIPVGERATFKSVSAGASVVVAVDDGGRVWIRTGLGPNTQTGVAWKRHPSVTMKMVEVMEVDGTIALWALTPVGNLYFSLLYHE